MRTISVAIIGSLLFVSYAQASEEVLPPSFAQEPSTEVGDGAGPTSGAPADGGVVALPSLVGPVGLYRLSTADVGQPGHLRLGLHGEYFSKAGFLISAPRGAGDRNMRLQGALTFGFTPLRFLELFGGVFGSANRNRRICTDGPNGETCTSEPGRADPEVIKSYGDLIVGTKLAHSLGRGLSLGGEGGLRFLSSVSGISVDPDATSVWLSGLGSWNAGAVSAIPLRAHLNVGLYFDNSPNVQDSRNVSRGSYAVSSFAYGIGRDRVRTALGLEYPLAGLGGGALSVIPFAEYHAEVVIADPDPTFADFREPRCGGAGQPTCSDHRDQMWVTLGARAQHRSGFTVGAGVDLGIRSPGFPYGPPIPPYNVIVSLAHSLDLGGPRVVTRTVTVEKPVQVARAPQEGVVTGRVVNAAGAPIEGAIVGVAGRAQSRVATDPDGSFRTPPLPPGPAELVVMAPGYDGASAAATVVAGRPTELTLTLTPRQPAAKLTGRVFDDAGRPVQATVRALADGRPPVETQTDATGAFAVAVPPGPYVVRVESDRHLAKEARATASDGNASPVAFTVRTKPAIAAVAYSSGKLVVRQPVVFKGTSGPAATELDPRTQQLLDEVVDVLARNPDIRQVRVEAHWDSSVGKERAQQLTDAQARAVADYLTKQGVAAERVVAVGLGATKPVVPNLGHAARTKNRRVEFQVATN